MNDNNNDNNNNDDDEIDQIILDAGNLATVMFITKVKISREIYKAAVDEMFTIMDADTIPVRIREAVVNTLASYDELFYAFDEGE